MGRTLVKELALKGSDCISTTKDVDVPPALTGAAWVERRKAEFQICFSIEGAGLLMDGRAGES